MNWLHQLTTLGFQAHGFCYRWQTDVLWMHVISDASIALAYFAIPIILLMVLKRHKASFPYANILVFFVAFILMCGITHVMGIVVTWYPLYEIQGWLKAITATVSVFTVMLLVPKLPELIAIPGIKLAYTQTESKLQSTKEELARTKALTKASVERENRIIQLKQEVNALLRQQGLQEKYLSSSATPEGSESF